MKFFKKHWNTILFLLLIVLLVVPQTRMPIQVGIQRLFSFSPSEVSEENRESVQSYNWALQTLNGAPKNFNASEGKVVLINYWATWCPPCVAEMPSLQELYDAYGTKVDFYFISSETPETLAYFLQKKNYDLPVYIPQQQAPKELNANSLPTTYLLSKDGSIVIKEIGAAHWSSEKVTTTIDRLLKE
ncbi:MAG: TlpA family protein disulfide reductase [Flavobacteriales bacterium]|uniref:TlpA family protein disulfide reductase n=1 Tax=Candidatus Ulvibacter alkanivorans TaxID=2267620 RepID=UPI000DF3B04C|nr:TlpA disulfide reductase family protein [Candidatus Ulvibacter alkanivorans]MCH2489739.1 TlpA family protein disulfide reductase [Flavobacteriales bacterium]